MQDAAFSCVLLHIADVYYYSGEVVRTPKPQPVFLPARAFEVAHSGYEFSRASVVDRRCDVYAGAARQGVEYDIQAGILLVCLYAVLQAGGIDSFLVGCLLELEKRLPVAVYSLRVLLQEQLLFERIDLNYVLPA